MSHIVFFKARELKNLRVSICVCAPVSRKGTLPQEEKRNKGANSK